MEEEYWAECVACETETQVLVVDSEEVPQYCPMCGSPIEFEVVNDQYKQPCNSRAIFFMWYYNGKVFEETPEEYQGFVYEITEVDLSLIHI